MTLTRFNNDTKKEAKLQRQRSLKGSYYRTYEDSPIFYNNLGAIATSGKVLIDFETDHPTSKKFFPLTNIQIINGSSADVIFYPNQQSSGFVIAQGTSVVFDRKSLGGGLRSFKITNSSSSVTINDKEIETNAWRESVTIEQGYEKLHKALFKFINPRGV